MAPEAKKIAQEYVQQQLTKMSGKTPAQREINAAVKKVASAIEEIRNATAAHATKRSIRWGV